MQVIFTSFLAKQFIGIEKYVCAQARTPFPCCDVVEVFHVSGTRDKNCLSLKKLFPWLETTVLTGTEKMKYEVSI